MRLYDKTVSYIWPQYGGLLMYRPGSRFRVCGYLGLISAAAITITLSIYTGLSLWTVFWILLSTIGVFVFHLMFYRFMERAQQLVLYPYLCIVFAIAVIVPLLRRQSTLSYLDVTAIGFATFVAVGRVGCFMVGCCHGRPSRFGICYGEQHVSAAFPAQFLGVRLFPVQLLESMWLAFIVIIGSYFIWSRHIPGTALTLFIAAYCPARFCFEFMRWRPRRSYYLGLSEAQWTSLALMTLLASLEVLTVLPFSRWHIFIAIGLIILTVLFVLWNYWQRLKHPQQDFDSGEEVKFAVELSDLCNEKKSYQSFRI